MLRIYRAISTGVYSALARWQVSTDGGVNWSAALTLPTIADGVYSNGFTITVDVDSFASFYSRQASTGVSFGGVFNMTNNRTMVGDVMGPGSASASTVSVNGMNTPTFIIGNVGGGIGQDSRGVLIQNTTGAGLVTIIGNIAGRGAGGNTASAGVLMFSGVGCSIIGDATYGVGGFAIIGGGASITRLVGRAIGTATLAAVQGVTCDEIEGLSSGCIVRNKLIIPFQGCAVPQIAAGFSPVIEYANESNAVITYTNVNSQDQADPADVRSATVYANGTLTGTCNVPPAASVALNVPVDNTVGSLATAAVVAADLLNEMNNSNLTIAQGLRDGMGASAAAIAAVGSINVIP